MAAHPTGTARRIPMQTPRLPPQIELVDTRATNDAFPVSSGYILDAK
jgi:hypothetical protein